MIEINGENEAVEERKSEGMKEVASPEENYYENKNLTKFLADNI